MVTKAGRIQPVAPDLRPAIKELDIPDDTDLIVLVNPDVGPVDRSFQNLVRRDADSRVVWTADLPKPDGANGYDCYVDVRWDDGCLAANSWSGYYTLLDPDTGRVTSQEFVK